MSQGKKVRFHAVSVKLDAVRRVQGGEAVSSVALSIGVRRTQVYYWLELWRKAGGFGQPQRGRPRRGVSFPSPGSVAREVELERLVGQQQVELDFFRQALRQVGDARRRIAGPGVASCSGSSQPGPAGRKAD